MLVLFKPKTYGYLAQKLIQHSLGQFTLEPLRFSEIFKTTNYKFPLICRYTLEELKKLSGDLNENKNQLVRVSKLYY